MTSRHDPPDLLDDPEQGELNRLLAETVAPVTLPGQRQDWLRARLMERVGRSVIAHAGLLTVRLHEGVWQTLKRGIRFKSLRAGPEGNCVLIEFAPNTALPRHRHRWLEEGIVLRGGLQMGDLELGPGDYHASPARSRHQSIRSQHGALAYLCGTSLGDTRAVFRELLGGLLPAGGGAARTVFDADEGWVEVAPGVWRKDLWTDRFRVSRLFRLDPGATVPPHAHVADEECMMLAGDVFVGDILLRAGDYQLAPAGTEHGEIYTDVGGSLFVRGAPDY